MSGIKDLSERDIITKLIIPKLMASGWDLEKQIAERKKLSEDMMQAVLREAF